MVSFDKDSTLNKLWFGGKENVIPLQPHNLWVKEITVLEKKETF